MYAAENGGRYPDDFAALLLTQDLTAEVFICSSSQGERAPGATPQEQAKQLSDPLHQTYMFVAPGLDPKASPDALVAYDASGNHSTDGVNALFADGHVEFVGGRNWKQTLGELKARHAMPRQPATGPATQP